MFGRFRRKVTRRAPLLWLILMLRCESSVPMMDELMLRRLLVVPQDVPLNPVLVRSPASMILMLASPAPGLMLMGTLWLPLVILMELLLRRAIATRL